MVLASSSSYQEDEPDSKSLLSSRGSSFDLLTLLDRLKTDMGTIALFSGKELELLSEMEPSEIVNTDKYSLEFLTQIQEAADRHLKEKREIRDALGLLKIYQKSSSSEEQKSSPSKRKRKDKNWRLWFYIDYILYLFIVIWSYVYMYYPWWCPKCTRNACWQLCKFSLINFEIASLSLKRM